MGLSVVGDGDDDKRKPGRPSGDEFDPWDTEKSLGYDPDAFYTRSTNKHDHSLDIRFKFPPQLGAMAAEIVDSKAFPALRSTADVYRNAAVHSLHHLNEILKNPDYERRLTMEMRLTRLAASREEFDKMIECVDAHAENMRAARDAKDIMFLDSVVAYAEEDLEALRNPHHDNLEKLIVEHRTILKGMREAQGMSE